MEKDAPWLQGQVLLALPAIGDPRFARAVILIVSSGPDGAMGIGVSAPVEALTAGKVLDQLDIEHDDSFDQPVLMGGPVDPGRGFVLHSRDWSEDDSCDIAGRWMLSSSRNVLQAIVDGRGPKRWQIALGYAGWGAGQLEQEFSRHAWHMVTADDAILFDTSLCKRWSAAFGSINVDVHHLSAQGGTA